MKQTMIEIAEIEKRMAYLQDLHVKNEAFGKQIAQDLLARKKQAEDRYANEIERIDNQKKQADKVYSQSLSNLSLNRKDAETKNQNDHRMREKQIRSRYESIIQSNKKMISWIEDHIAEMPSKLIKKVISGPPIAPSMVDAKVLEDLYNKIFDGTFRAGINRTFRIDGFSPKSQMIQEFIGKAISYKLYLENNIKLATTRCATEISAEYRRAQNQRQNELNRIASQEKMAGDAKMHNHQACDQQKNAALSKKNTEIASIEQLKKKYDTELAARKTDFINKKNSFLQSDLVVHFMERVGKRLVGTGALDSDWKTYDPKGKYTRYVIGNILRPISVSEPGLISALQAVLPKAFRGGSFRIPLVLGADQSANFFVHYQQNDKKQICEFIQCVVLQKMRCAETGNIEIYFAEPDKSGQILGPLSARIQENEAIGIYNINSKDSIKETIKKLSNDIDEINGLLGNDSNVYEYNKTHTPRINEKCLVLADVAGILDKEDWDLLKLLWSNGARCGITILFISAHSIENITALYPHMNVDVSYLHSSDLYLVSCINNKCYIKHGKSDACFFMSTMTDARREFVQVYRQAVLDSQKVDTCFAAYFNAEKEYPYQNSNKEISLPIMVKNGANGGISNFIIDSSTHVHSVITGGNGAGKSTFLKMMIASIVMNYHPDEVEIWLVDYSKASFASFVKKRPPHVRFVALETTKEFTYSFLEYLKRFFGEERSAAYRKANNVDQVDKYRAIYGDRSMPRVVLIIDEFHVMAQHAKESPIHATILENVLREYRKYGLSCVFSDQSDNLGIKSEAQQQIHNHLAMMQRQDPGAILRTLSLTKNDVPDEIWERMRATEQGEIWKKVPGGVDQLKAVYINDAELTKVIETSISRGDSISCDKQVYVIDGERKPVNLQGISRLLSNAPTTEPAFCIGVPTNIEPLFKFVLERRYDNNILIAGRNTEIGNDVIAQLLLSAVLKGNNRVVIFADPGEQKLPDIQTLLNAWHVIDHVEIYADYPEICREVKKMSEHVKQRQVLTKPTLLLWLGLRDIYDELSRCGDAPIRTEEKQHSFEVSKEKALADEMLVVQAEALGVSVAELLEILSTDPAPEGTSHREEIYGVYNAILDINNLLSVGGKCSLYSIVAIESTNDMKRLTGVKTDYFQHKIGFAMTHEDSSEFGFGRRASDIPGEDIALYTRGVQHTMFRPFLSTKNKKGD